MPVIGISVTEVELYVVVQCKQNIFFIWCLSISLGVEMELPMVHEVDNEGAVDLISGWFISK